MRVKKAKRRPGRPPFVPAEPVNAAPKGAQLRAKLDQPQPFGMRKLPPAVTDAIAERKISGGFDTQKKNLSRCCNVARSVSGHCGLCGLKGKQK